MTPTAELHAAAALIRNRAWAFPLWALALPDLLDRAAELPPYNRFRPVQDAAAEVARAILGTDQDAGRPA
jgi:hypothetical protein